MQSARSLKSGASKRDSWRPARVIPTSISVGPRTGRLSPPCSLHGRQSFSSGLTMIPSGTSNEQTALPVTPFHFGPGLALKGVAAPVFSWSAFAAAQVVIDCETIYYMVRGEYPVHRFLHSFLGGGMAGRGRRRLFLR